MAEHHQAPLQPCSTPRPLCPQHGGALWPSESCQARASWAHQDSRLGHVSLTPLRGNESEMRSSVVEQAWWGWVGGWTS